MTELHFIVRAAVSEETNNGWVWVQTPCDTRLDSELTPRTIVTIKQKGEPCWSCIYVEVRKIDDNFRKQYNCKASTVSICQKKNVVVMSEWYRQALGIVKTTPKNDESQTEILLINRSKLPVWRSLRAACHHPDLVVRLGTRLGITGVWLGIVGVGLGLMGTNVLNCVQYGKVLLASIFLLFAILGIVAARRPHRPRVIA